MADSIDKQSKDIDRMRIQKGKEYQVYQKAQNQFLNIQAAKKQNLATQRAISGQQYQQMAMMQQAAQLSAMSGGQGAVQQQVNPQTQAILSQYGMGKPRFQRTQQQSQQVTRQNVIIHNTTNNNTTNNVRAGGYGGPVQGRDLRLKDNNIAFKTWINSAFAKQQEQAQIRDRNYEKRESMLTRDSNKMMRKLESAGKSIGERLNPERLTSGMGKQFKALMLLLGLQHLRKNWKSILGKISSMWTSFKKFIKDKFNYDLDNVSTSSFGDITSKVKENIRRGLDKANYSLIVAFGGDPRKGETIGDVIKQIVIGDDSHYGLFMQLKDFLKSEFRDRADSIKVMADRFPEDAKKKLNDGDLVEAMPSVLNWLGGIIGCAFGGSSYLDKGLRSMDMSDYITSKEEVTKYDNKNGGVGKSASQEYWKSFGKDIAEKGSDGKWRVTEEGSKSGWYVADSGNLYNHGANAAISYVDNKNNKAQVSSFDTAIKVLGIKEDIASDGRLGKDIIKSYTFGGKTYHTDSKEEMVVFRNVLAKKLEKFKGTDIYRYYFDALDRELAKTEDYDAATIKADKKTRWFSGKNGDYGKMTKDGDVEQGLTAGSAFLRKISNTYNTKGGQETFSADGKNKRHSHEEYYNGSTYIGISNGYLANFMVGDIKGKPGYARITGLSYWQFNHMSALNNSLANLTTATLAATYPLHTSSNVTEVANCIELIQNTIDSNRSILSAFKLSSDDDLVMMVDNNFAVNHGLKVTENRGAAVVRPKSTAELFNGHSDYLRAANAYISRSLKNAVGYDTLQIGGAMLAASLICWAIPGIGWIAGSIIVSATWLIGEAATSPGIQAAIAYASSDDVNKLIGDFMFLDSVEVLKRPRQVEVGTSVKHKLQIGGDIWYAGYVGGDKKWAITANEKQNSSYSNVRVQTAKGSDWKEFCKTIFGDKDVDTMSAEGYGAVENWMMGGDYDWKKSASSATRTSFGDVFQLQEQKREEQEIISERAEQYKLDRDKVSDSVGIADRAAEISEEGYWIDKNKNRHERTKDFTGQCVRGVSTYFEAAGAPSLDGYVWTSSHAHAADASKKKGLWYATNGDKGFYADGTNLDKIGFNPVDGVHGDEEWAKALNTKEAVESAGIRKGDIMLQFGDGGAKGTGMHIQMWNGENWVSDATQDSSWVEGKGLLGDQSAQVWRYNGGKSGKSYRTGEKSGAQTANSTLEILKQKATSAKDTVIETGKTVAEWAEDTFHEMLKAMKERYEKAESGKIDTLWHGNNNEAFTNYEAYKRAGGKGNFVDWQNRVYALTGSMPGETGISGKGSFSKYLNGGSYISDGAIQASSRIGTNSGTIDAASWAERLKSAWEFDGKSPEVRAMEDTNKGIAGIAKINSSMVSCLDDILKVQAGIARKLGAKKDSDNNKNQQSNA